MPNNQAHDPRVATAGERVAQAVGLSVASVAGGGGGGPSPGAFTPLLVDDFSSGTPGNTVTTGAQSFWYDGFVVYDQTRAFSGNQSMKITMPSADGQTCGGFHSYGGKVVLPQPIPKGKSIWFGGKFFFPSTFSWGYVYGGSDAAAASACGNSNDGFGRHKFIVFETSDNLRLYLQLHGSRRAVSRVPGLTIDPDIGLNSGTFETLDANYLIPQDQWVDIKVQVYVDDTSAGFYRVWTDGIYKGQANGPTLTSAGATITKVGIGDYLNGVHYTDGQAGRSEFWVDEIIVASDVVDNGTPTGIDAGGRTFIDPATLVGDL